MGLGQCVAILPSFREQHESRIELDIPLNGRKDASEYLFLFAKQFICHA
jgi:hypothetical protein